MDKKTNGSWLVYQTAKLDHITGAHSFDNNYVAGKSAILLSAISRDNETEVTRDRVETLAKASGISRLELPALLETLAARDLINIGTTGIAVLGITPSTALEHASNIFFDSEPTRQELAALTLCEASSNAPLLVERELERLSDEYRLSSQETKSLIKETHQIGFIEQEVIDKTKTLLFNGNLFRRDDVEKVQRVLDSLSASERALASEFALLLNRNACVHIDQANQILGTQLFNKLAAVGIYDISIVSNDREEATYVTRPSAFSKFSNSFVDDAFDLAKMFVSALTYGMTRSSYNRGQIRMVEALVNTLIAGQPIGPVDAIGQDYRILELKGVVRVYHGEKNGRRGYLMTLLKKEIGELALGVIKTADISSHSLETLPGAAVNRFRGPEQNRIIARRKTIERNDKATNSMLLALRTGGKSNGN